MMFRLDRICGVALLALLAGPGMAFDRQSAPWDTTVEDGLDANNERAFDQPLTVPRLSRAMLDVLPAAIRPCWSTSLASDAAVTVRVIMNRDGTVESAELADIGDDAGPDHQAAAQSALRAVLNPNCQPWPLPAEDWPNWQYMELRFDPRSAF